MENNIILGAMNQRLIKKASVYSGGFELIDAKSVLYYDGDLPLEIEEIFDESSKIVIKIITKKDESKKRNIEFHVIPEKNIIEYTCVNFDDSFGTGTRTPIEIGRVAGKKIFIHFWIYAMGVKGNSRKIEYSIWKER